MKKITYRIVPKKQNHNRALLIAALILILFAVAGGTLSFLSSGSDEAVNRFVPGSVTGEISETFNDSAKTSAKIKNTGNVAAYIRVAAVGVEINDAGQVIGSYDVSSFIDTDKWDLVGGYYYYKGSVAPGAYTEDILKSGGILLKRTDEGDHPVTHNFQVTIVAELIQAEGTKTVGGQSVSAAADAWKADYSAGLESGGSWTAVQGGN